MSQELTERFLKTIETGGRDYLTIAQPQLNELAQQSVVEQGSIRTYTNTP